MTHVEVYISGRPALVADTDEVEIYVDGVDVMDS